MPRLERALVLTLACVAACQTLVHAQSSIPSANHDAQRVGTCPPVRSSHDSRPSERQVSIAGVLGASGSLQMPAAEQDQIFASVTQKSYAGSFDEVKEEVEERLRNEWMNRGYFKVQVSSDGNVLTVSPDRERIVLTVHIEEGRQYRLGQITFKNNRAITSADALRNLFPIKDGEIFDREAISKGLNNLGKAYGQLGYINFTSIPNTTINEDAQTISLDFDVDEGKQFVIRSIDIEGAETQVLKDLALRPGQVYNQRLVAQFLQKHFPGVDVDNPGFQHRSLDERSGTVALTFDFRQCSIK
jgi:outer membrane translocation and assembly module TamA